MLCPNCGADLGDRQVKFCPNCGNNIPVAAPQPKPNAAEPVSLWEDLQFEKVINKSRDSILYQAFCKQTNEYAAVHVITVPAQWEDCEKLLNAGMSADDVKKHFAEIANARFMLCRRLRSLHNSKNIVKVDDVRIVKKDQLRWEIQIRTELLTPFSSIKFGTDIKEGAVAKLAADLCDAVAVLNGQQINIGGICLDDIFMDRQGNYKLGVFADAQCGISAPDCFCAPEALSGGYVDSRSDVYSIGLLMYYLLNDKQKPDTDLMLPPKNASSRLAKVIAGACSQDPGGRYVSAEQLKHAIMDAFRSPKPVGAAEKPPVKTDKPVKPPKNSEKKNSKGLLIGILAAVIALVLAAAVFFGIRWLRNSDLELPAFAENIFGSDNKASVDEDWEAEDDSHKGQSTKPDKDDPAQNAEPDQETEPEPVLMPHVVGTNYSSAVETLSALGCVVTFEYEYSDTVEKDFVITQSVAPDHELPETRNIVLWVSMGPDSSPDGYDQKVVVTAGSGSSYGTLVFYEWEEGQWISKFSCDATVGKNGISTNYGEGKGRTPEGVFKLGVALSANSIPNSEWPFQQVSSNTCVVDDVNSAYYNTIQNKNNVPSGTSVDPIGNTIVKGYSTVCIYIEHNGNGLDSDGVVAGKGSVITLCGRSGSLKPTAGCVDISSSNMTTLLGLLDYSKNPHIEMYVQ